MGDNVTLTEEHLALRESVRDFTQREVVPIADHLDSQAKEIPMEVIRKMAELGYFGLTLPEEYGGSAMDHTCLAIMTEELSRGWLSVGSVGTRLLIASTLILAHGTEEQKKKYLPRIASGACLTAAAFTEPDVGSDTASVALRAEKVAGNWKLTGAKSWCTMANRAHMLTVLCKTNPEAPKKHDSLSILLVDKEPGDGFVPPTMAGDYIPAIGYHGLKSWNVMFEDHLVPEDAVLGGVTGKGFRQLMVTYESARIQTAARAVGVAQASFDAALRYSKERFQFGKAISEFQIIKHKLAHMATEIEAARQLTYHAARAKDSGRRADLEAGMAKAFAADMAERVTSEALQIYGGYGYSKEYPVQRYWRDGRLFKVFEGTSEIQYEVIAKRLLSGE